MTSFGNALIALATNGISILYGISYGIAVVIISIGAYKMLADGASGMEALVASLKRVIIAIIIIAFSMTFVNTAVKSFSGISPTSGKSKSGLNASLFNVDENGFKPETEASIDNEITALNAKIMIKQVELQKMQMAGVDGSKIVKLRQEIADLEKKLEAAKKKKG